MYFILDGNIHNVSWYVCWRNTTHVSVSLCTLMEAYMYTNGVILYRFIKKQEFYEHSWSE